MGARPGCNRPAAGATSRREAGGLGHLKARLIRVRKERAALYVGVALVSCTTTGAAPVQAQQAPAKLTQFLSQSIGLDSAQLIAVESGKPVVKVLETQNKRDVAVFGIITADVPRAFYVVRMRDFQNSLRAPTRNRFGIFSNPATLADVQDVTIDSEDVADVRRCRPGDCKIKMPATEMQRIRQEIDWSAADPGAQLNAYVRQRMVQYITDYRARGDSAMAVYDDLGNVRASDAFSALLAQSPYVFEYVAPLHEYLAGYPQGTLAGVNEVLYWSEDALPGLKPILNITHLSVYTPPELPTLTVMAGKQIYADHYFEAAFDLMAVVDRPISTDKQGIYLIVIRRFRFDDLPTGIFNIRGKVVGKLRDKTRTDLEREKASSERALGH